MPSNIKVVVSADVADLQAKLAVAKAESAGFTKELNSLARQMSVAGDSASDDLKAKTLQAAEAVVQAKSQVSNLSSELKTGGDAARQFGGDITVAEGALGEFGIALSLGGLLAFARTVVDTGRDIQRQADSLSIGAETLQAYQYEARDSGVAVDEATSALRRFEVGLGQLQETGEGPLAKDLQTLGLTADELQGDPAEALIIFARALDNVKDATVRAAIEKDAFGRTGVDLTELMHKIAEGTGDVSDKLEEMKNKARDAGQLIDTQTTRSLQELSDDMDKFVFSAKAGAAAIVEYLVQLGRLDYAEAENSELAARLLARGYAMPQNGRDLPGNGRSNQMPGPQPGPLTAAEARAFKDQGFKPQIPDVPEPDIEIDDGKEKQKHDKSIEEARRTADEITKIYEQADLAHVQSEERTNDYLLQIGGQTNEQFIAQAEKLENDRYKIELDAIHAKEAQDAKNKFALAKDQAEEEVLTRQHEDRLTALHEQATIKRIEQTKKETQEFVKDQEQELQTATKGVEDLYEMHAVNDQQRHDMERALTVSIEQEILKRKDAEIAYLKSIGADWKQALAERTELERKFAADVKAIDTTLVKSQEATFEQGFDIMGSSFNNAITGMMFHGETFKQAELQMFSSIGEGAMNMALQMGEKWMESQLEMLLFSKTTDSQKITSDAAVTYAGTMAAFSDIPTPGFAEAMAAEREMMVLSQLGSVGAAGGMERVPFDEFPISAHKDESVLPAKVARPLMDFVDYLPMVAAAANANFQKGDVPASTKQTSGTGAEATLYAGERRLTDNYIRQASKAFGVPQAAAAAAAVEAVPISFGGPSINIGNVTHAPPRIDGPSTINAPLQVSAIDQRSVARFLGQSAPRRQFEKMVKRAVRGGMPKGLNR